MQQDGVLYVQVTQNKLNSPGSTGREEHVPQSDNVFLTVIGQQLSSVSRQKAARINLVGRIDLAISRQSFLFQRRQTVASLWIPLLF